MIISVLEQKFTNLILFQGFSSKDMAFLIRHISRPIHTSSECLWLADQPALVSRQLPFPTLDDFHFFWKRLNHRPLNHWFGRNNPLAHHMHMGISKMNFTVGPGHCHKQTSLLYLGLFRRLMEYFLIKKEVPSS